VSPFDEAFRRAGQVLEREARSARRDQERALRFLDLPPARRELLQVNGPPCGRGAIHVFLSAAARARPHDLLDAIDLAGRAVRVAQQVGDGAERAIAAAELGNLYRIRGDHAAAERLLGRARTLAAAGGADPLDVARIESLRGSLLSDQRRFDQALVALRRATRIYARIEQTPALCLTLAKLSAVLGEAGQGHEAVATGAEAWKVARALGDPASSLLALHNIVHGLIEADLLVVAADYLEIARPLYGEYCDPATTLRHDWLEARLALGRGQFVEAHGLLVDVRNGLARRGEGYEWVLASVHLAMAATGAGYLAEVAALAARLEAPCRKLGLDGQSLHTLRVVHRVSLREALDFLGALLVSVRLLPIRPVPVPL